MRGLTAGLGMGGGALLAVLVTAPAWPPAVVFEPLWEAAAALGYVALAALVPVLWLAPARGALTPYRYRVHRAASYVAVLLVLVHAAVLVAGDPFMLDYLGWMMPVHVLAGILGAALLLAAAATREPWRHLARRLGARPATHAWIGIVALAATLAHVLMSATKLVPAWRPALLATALLVLALPALRHRLVRGATAAVRSGEPAHGWDARTGDLALMAMLLLVLLVGAAALTSVLRA